MVSASLKRPAAGPNHPSLYSAIPFCRAASKRPCPFRSAAGGCGRGVRPGIGRSVRAFATTVPTGPVDPTLSIRMKPATSPTTRTNPAAVASGRREGTLWDIFATFAGLIDSPGPVTPRGAGFGSRSEGVPAALVVVGRTDSTGAGTFSWAMLWRINSITRAVLDASESSFRWSSMAAVESCNACSRSTSGDDSSIPKELLFSDQRSLIATA